jgi:hypothetical protein
MRLAATSRSPEPQRIGGTTRDRAYVLHGGGVPTSDEGFETGVIGQRER